jgi:hypothetical protein
MKRNDMAKIFFNRSKIGLIVYVGYDYGHAKLRFISFKKLLTEKE